MNDLNELNLIDEKKFIIPTDNDKKMELILRNFNNEELLISINKINDLFSNKYELKCNLGELQKNRFFKIFVGIDEIMRELENKIEKSKIIEETNILYLEIPIGLTIFNEIILEIKEIEQSSDEKINDLKNKIEKLNNQLAEKDKQIEKYEKQIFKLTQKNNELLNEFDLNPINSKIINENEINLIIDWIKNNNNNNNNKNNEISFKLLYRASRDGDSSLTFHKLCDEKGPTVIFIKNEDNFRYGAFTSISWKNNNKYEPDSYSFLFSLTNKEKYLLKNKNDNFAISHSKNGPGFGYGERDLYIPDNCFTNKEFKCYSNSFQFDNEKMYGEKESFFVRDYEVYSVIIQ